MLSPYSKKLSEADAIHLLRRATFATNWKTIKEFTGKNSDEAVDLLLNNAVKPQTLPTLSWINEPIKTWWKLPADQQQPVIDAAYERVYKENFELKRWWMNAMAADTTSIREKMTLFWHGHFTSKFEIDEVMPAPSMYRQNLLFRNNHQGNFKNLVEKVSIDGAMLIFLNGKESTNKAPNENYSRELLELYTAGIGNYTEDDVKEGARVFTGWKVNFYKDEWTQFQNFEPFLVASEHDSGVKKYLGDTIPVPPQVTQAAVYEYEVQKLVGIILTKKADAVSNFICEKLYRYFIYSNPAKVNIDIIKSLAKTFRDNNWQIRPVLAELLKSNHFFDEVQRGIQIKSPSELIVGITKHFDVDGEWKEWVMKTMGQELLNPPNVAGWPGYRKWADTRTFPFAVQQISSFLWSPKNDFLVNWASQFDNKDDPKLLTEQILSLFLAKKPTVAQVDKGLKDLLGGSPDYEWPNMIKNNDVGGFRIRILLLQIVKMPDFHLT
jgi:uncharacterized protein (DUF1800 family)